MRTVDLNEISEFEKEFRRLRFNPIYFYEYYWKEKHPDEPELTREQKQKLYDEYRGTPFFQDFGEAIKHQERIKELKAQAYEDWEIMG